MFVFKAEELKKQKISKSLNQQRQLIIMHKNNINPYIENQRHKGANAKQAN